MALTALLQQGFGAKLTDHTPGQPLLELQGSPAKVNQVTLEREELLLTQLIPGYVQGVPMRINHFETAMYQLDDLHGGLLSGGDGQWPDGEAIKISMLLDHALRSIKRKGHTTCHALGRLRRLWNRCTEKHGLPTEISEACVGSLASQEAMLAIEGPSQDLPPTSPLMTLPGFPNSDGESECGKDAGAAPDAVVQLITDSDVDCEPVGGPTVQTNVAYKLCRLAIPDCTDVESPPVIDHQNVKAIRREIRKQKRGLCKRPAAAPVKRPAADPAASVKRPAAEQAPAKKKKSKSDPGPAADPAAPVKRPAADQKRGLFNHEAPVAPKVALHPPELLKVLSQQEYRTYMGRPILEVAADIDPHFHIDFAVHDSNVTYSVQRGKPIWQVIRNNEILVQTTVGPRSWLRADDAGGAAYTLRMLSEQGHAKASLMESKLQLLRMSTES